MKDLLLQAKSEIERLRRENEILHAKVEVMELFACVLHTQPARHVHPMEVDLVWQIQKELDALQEPSAPA